MRLIYFFITICFFISLTGCATKNYHANVVIKTDSSCTDAQYFNSPYKGIYYKLYQTDDLSEGKVINVINPIHSPIYSRDIVDTLDISWGGSYSNTKLKVSCGREHAYQKMSGFFDINDGDTKTVMFSYDPSSDATTDIIIDSHRY